MYFDKLVAVAWRATVDVGTFAVIKDGLVAEGSSRIVKRPVTKVYVDGKLFD